MSLAIDNYSDKACVIRGDEKYGPSLINAGFKFNPVLRGGEGWILPKSQKDKAKRLIKDLLTGSIEIMKENEVKASSRDFSLLVAKVEKISRILLAKGMMDKDDMSNSKDISSLKEQVDKIEKILINEGLMEKKTVKEYPKKVFSHSGKKAVIIEDDDSSSSDEDTPRPQTLTTKKKNIAAKKPMAKEEAKKEVKEEKKSKTADKVGDKKENKKGEKVKTDESNGVKKKIVKKT